MWYRMRRFVAILSLGAAALLACEGAAPPAAFVPEHDVEQLPVGEPAPPAPDAVVLKKVVARLYPDPPKLSSLGAK